MTPPVRLPRYRHRTSSLTLLPGDVQEERNKAKAVVEQLRRTFAGRLQLSAIFWEELSLQGTMSFQEGIDHPTTFSQRLRKHLSDHFEGICGDTKPVLVWAPGDKGSSYRGLEVFDYENSPIFFRRETETVAICDQLKQQAEGEFAFLLITGPSGSGNTPDSSRGYFELLEALARLRVVWVVATVRSDFYQECQAVPSLVRMKAGLGHIDLLPPGPDDTMTLARLLVDATPQQHRVLFPLVAANKGAYVKQIDETPMAPSTDREWFTLAVKVKPEAPASPQDNSLDSKSATTTTFFYTFVVFPAREYTIGSPEDELSKRDNDEVLHRVRLTRPFAILNREVTFAELIAFNPVRYNNLMKQMPLLQRPESTGAGVSWYDAVRFSRWLGAQYGLSESEQAYADPPSPMIGERDPDPLVNGAPKNWPLDVSRHGFRLASEAEWEIASRGGVRTSYGFGSDVGLLNGYGCFQVNSGGRMHSPMERRPSHRGLFDMHGNAFEWVHDWEGGFGRPSATDPLGAEGGSNLVYRGGSWSNVAANCRTASRVGNAPTFRWGNYGIRLALSFVGVPDESGQDKNK